MERVPEFWEWIEHHGQAGRIKIPIEVYEEIKDGKDALAQWAKQVDVRTSLLLAEEADPAIVARVINDGYAPDLTDDEIEKLGRDPFLIAYAIVDPNGRHIVTTEASRPSRRRGNRHIPDVCADFGVRSVNTFQLARELDFRTDWR